jgi:hypothetical protein
MKNLIRKILKEDYEDFDWVKTVDPLSDFNDYFYGIGDYEHRRRDSPGLYIKRDSSWWYNWVEDVVMAHPALMEDVADLESMVGDLVNPRRGKIKEYASLAKEVYEFTSPLQILGGQSTIQSAAAEIMSAYRFFGEYCEKNNLTIFEVLDIFTTWLDKMGKEGKPLHKNG